MQSPPLHRSKSTSLLLLEMLYTYADCSYAAPSINVQRTNELMEP